MSDLNCSFNIYHDAADAALENATDWLNLAEYALKSGTAGHAAALAIIANEEITKAYGCYIVAEGLMSENTTEFTTLFRDHYAKTEQMLGFYLIATLGTHAQMGLIDPNEFLKNILTANPREVALAEVQLDKQLQKSAREIQRRRTQGMYIGIKRERGKLIVKKPKNVRRSRAESTIQTVKDYHELVSMIVKTIRDHPEARKFFKEYLDMIIKESRQKVTLDFEV